MTQSPAEFAAWLTSVGLPAGPFAGPLRYHRRGTGKLHADDECPALRSHGEPVELPAEEVPADRLCGRCGGSFPGPAERWATVCRHIAWTRLAADEAAAGSWADIARLDQQRWTLAWFDRHRVSATMREQLAPVLADTYQRLDAARGAAHAAAPDDTEMLTAEARRRGLLPGGADGARRHVLALTPITSVTMLHLQTGDRFGPAELLAHLDVAIAGELGRRRGAAGYALAPAAVAALLVAALPTGADELIAHDLGPAGDGDTGEVLTTAARLLAEAQDDQPPGELPDAAVCAGLLSAARGIHHTPA